MKKPVPEFSNRRRIALRYTLRLCCGFFACLLAQSVSAEVAVLANRSVATITIKIVSDGEAPKDLSIPSGDSLPVFFHRTLQVRFGAGLRSQQFELEAANAYFFVRAADGKSLQLESIGLGEPRSPQALKGKICCTLQHFWIPCLRRRAKVGPLTFTCRHTVSFLLLGCIYVYVHIYDCVHDYLEELLFFFFSFFLFSSLFFRC